MPKISGMNNNKVFFKTVVLLATLLTLSACAGGAETEWASHNDPESDNIQQEVPEDGEGDDGDVAQQPPPPPPPVTTPDPKLIFYSDGKQYKLAHGNGQYWDGCKSSALARGGYLSDKDCGRALIHPSFFKHLNKHFYQCVENAAQSAGLSQPSRVFINHVGSYVNRNARNSSSLSFHAYARALDIKNFNVIDSRGNVTRISTHINDFKGSTIPFYNKFRSCWRATMPSKCTSSQREYKGSIGHTKSELGGNSLHKDHIHLSYPSCAGA